jgi:hypothetical protein
MQHQLSAAAAAAVCSPGVHFSRAAAPGELAAAADGDWWPDSGLELHALLCRAAW